MARIILLCESGRCIAFYEHRTDIIANGENEKDAKRNLKKMYKTVTEQEEGVPFFDRLRPHHRDRLLLGLIIVAIMALWRAVIWLFS